MCGKPDIIIDLKRRAFIAQLFDFPVARPVHLLHMRAPEWEIIGSTSKIFVLMTLSCRCHRSISPDRSSISWLVLMALSFINEKRKTQWI